MKTRRKTVILAAVLALCAVLSVFTFAADSAYDSTKDPLISKSYLDARLAELNSTIAGQNEQISALNGELSELKESVASLKADSEALNNAYKDEVNALKDEIKTLNDSIKALNKEIETLKEDVVKATEGDRFVAIRLTKGQTLYAKGGSLEMILRTGSAKVVSPFKTGSTKQGISDNTNGLELFDGENISLNDLLLIPRGDDGRGMYITSSSAYIMVRGNYEIK